MALIVGDVVTNFVANMEGMFAKMDEVVKRLDKLQKREIKLKIEFQDKELMVGVKRIADGIDKINQQFAKVQRFALGAAAATSSAVAKATGQSKNLVVKAANDMRQGLAGVNEEMVEGATVTQLFLGHLKNTAATFVKVGGTIAALAFTLIPGFSRSATEASSTLDGVADSAKRTFNEASGLGKVVLGIAGVITGGMALLADFSGQVINFVANIGTSLGQLVGWVDDTTGAVSALGEVFTSVWGTAAALVATFWENVTHATATVFGFSSAVHGASSAMAGLSVWSSALAQLSLALFGVNFLAGKVFGLLKKFQGARPNTTLGRAAELINTVHTGLVTIISPLIIIMNRLFAATAIIGGLGSLIIGLISGFNTFMSAFSAALALLAGVRPLIINIFLIARLRLLQVAALLGVGRAQFILFLRGMRESFQLLQRFVGQLSRLPRTFSIVAAGKKIMAVLVGIHNTLLSILSALARTPQMLGLQREGVFQLWNEWEQVGSSTEKARSGVERVRASLDESVTAGQKTVLGLVDAFEFVSQWVTSTFKNIVTASVGVTIETVKGFGKGFGNTVKFFVGDAFKTAFKALKVTAKTIFGPIFKPFAETFRTVFNIKPISGFFGVLKKTGQTALAAVTVRSSDFREKLEKIWGPPSRARIQKTFDQVTAGLNESNRRSDQIARQVAEREDAIRQKFASRMAAFEAAEKKLAAAKKDALKVSDAELAKQEANLKRAQATIEVEKRKLSERKKVEAAAKQVLATEQSARDRLKNTMGQTVRIMSDIGVQMRKHASASEIQEKVQLAITKLEEKAQSVIRRKQAGAKDFAQQLRDEAKVLQSNLKALQDGQQIHRDFAKAQERLNRATEKRETAENRVRTAMQKEADAAERVTATVKKQQEAQQRVADAMKEMRHQRAVFSKRAQAEQRARDERAIMGLRMQAEKEEMKERARRKKLMATADEQARLMAEAAKKGGKVADIEDQRLRKLVVARMRGNAQDAQAIVQDGASKAEVAVKTAVDKATTHASKSVRSVASEMARVAEGMGRFGGRGAGRLPALFERATAPGRAALLEGDPGSLVANMTKQMQSAVKATEGSVDQFQAQMRRLVKIAEKGGSDTGAAALRVVIGWREALQTTTKNVKSDLEVMGAEMTRTMGRVVEAIPEKAIRPVLARAVGEIISTGTVEARKIERWLSQLVDLKKLTPKVRAEIAGVMVGVAEELADYLKPLSPNTKKMPLGNWQKELIKSLGDHAKKNFNEKARGVLKNVGETMRRGFFGVWGLVRRGVLGGLVSVRNAFGRVLNEGIRKQLPQSPPLLGPLAGGFLTNAGGKIVQFLSFGILKSDGILAAAVNKLVSIIALPFLPLGVIAKALSFGISKVLDFGKALVGLGRSAPISALTETAQKIRDIGFMAARADMGERTAEFDHFRQALELTGVEGSQLETVFLTLTRRVAEASQGNVEAAAQMARWGVNVQEFAKGNLSLVDVFRQLQVAYEENEGNLKEQNAILDATGAAFGNLRSIFLLGSEEIEENLERIAKVGVLVDKESVKRAHNLQKAYKEVGLIFDGIKRELLDEFFPILQAQLERVSDWWTKNRPTIIAGIRLIGTTAGIVFDFIGRKLSQWFRDPSDFFNDFARLLRALGESALVVLTNFFRRGWSLVTKWFTLVGKLFGPLLEMVWRVWKQLVWPKILNSLKEGFKFLGREFDEWWTRIKFRLSQRFDKIRGTSAATVALSDRLIEIRKEKEAEERAAREARVTSKEIAVRLEQAKRDLQAAEAMSEASRKALREQLDLGEKARGPAGASQMVPFADANEYAQSVRIPLDQLRRNVIDFEAQLKRVRAREKEAAEARRQQMEQIVTFQFPATFGEEVVGAVKDFGQELSGALADTGRDLKPVWEGFVEDVGGADSLAKIDAALEKFRQAVKDAGSMATEEQKKAVEAAATSLARQRKLGISPEQIKALWTEAAEAAKASAGTFADIARQRADSFREAREAGGFLAWLGIGSQEEAQLEIEAILAEAAKEKLEVEGQFLEARKNAEIELEKLKSVFQATAGDATIAQINAMTEQMDAITARILQLDALQEEALASREEAVQRQVDAVSRKPFEGLGVKAADAIGEGLKKTIDELSDPDNPRGFRFDRLIGNIFSGLRDALQSELIEEVTSNLKTSLTDMFKSVFSFAGDLAGTLASTTMFVVSSLLSAADDKLNVTREQVNDVVQATETVRGVISGETTVKLKEVADNLRDALEPTNDILRSIRSDLRLMHGGGGLEPTLAATGAI